MRYGFNYRPQQFNSSFGGDSPFSDKNVYNTQTLLNDRYGNRNYADNNPLNHQTYNDRYGQNAFNSQQNPLNQPQPQQPNIRFDYPNSNNGNDGTPRPPSFNSNNNPSTPSYNPPVTTYNPNNPNSPYAGDRNRFENPYDTNQDRFNLNQRYYDQRQRNQEDRRYQIELEKLRNLLVETDQQGSQECTANVAAQWNFETNVNEYTQTEAVSKFL